MIPFTGFDWSTIPPIRHEGTTGYALWHTLQVGGLRKSNGVRALSVTVTHLMPQSSRVSVSRLLRGLKSRFLFFIPHPHNVYLLTNF